MDAKSTRFNPWLDNILLREAVAVLPKTKIQWDVIHSNVNNALKATKPAAFVTLRSCKDRLKSLQDCHKKGELASLRASGTDEEYTERQQLLTELAMLEEENKGAVTEEKENNPKEEQGKEIRKAAMETLKKKKADSAMEDSEASGTPKKRRSSNSDVYVKYLQDKLEHEKERFELEKKEREAKLQHDQEVMRIMLAVIENKKD